MNKPMRDPLLSASPSQTFPDTPSLLAYLRVLMPAEGRGMQLEVDLRDSLLGGLYNAVSGFKASNYPTIIQGGDCTYTLNMATFQVVHESGVRRVYRKIKIFVYDDPKLPSVHVFEANILLPLTPEVTTS